MEKFLQNQLDLAQLTLQGTLSETQREHWMGFKDAIQRVRKFAADQPAFADAVVLQRHEIEDRILGLRRAALHCEDEYQASRLHGQAAILKEIINP